MPYSHVRDTFSGQTLNEKYLLTQKGWNIRFNASLHTTQNNCSYKWTYGDGTATGWDYKPVTFHSYNIVAEYHPILSIKNNQSQITTIELFHIKVIEQNYLPRIVIDWEEFHRCHSDRPVEFNATSSYDPDGDEIQFKWDFGDGNTSTSPLTERYYSEVGRYTISLTIIDSNGDNSSATFKIDIIKRQEYTNGGPPPPVPPLCLLPYVILIALIIGFIIMLTQLFKQKKRKRSKRKKKKRRKRITRDG